MIKVKGYDTLYRDRASGAIINKDRMGAQAAMERYELREVQSDRISALEDKLSRVEMLLEKLIEK